MVGKPTDGRPPVHRDIKTALQEKFDGCSTRDRCRPSDARCPECVGRTSNEPPGTTAPLGEFHRAVRENDGVPYRQKHCRQRPSPSYAPPGRIRPGAPYKKDIY